MAEYGWKGDVFEYRNDRGTVAMDYDDLPESVNKFWIQYGFKQWFASYMAKAANGTQSEALDIAREAIVRGKAGDVKRKGMAVDLLMPDVYKILAEAHFGPGETADMQAAAFLAEWTEADETRRAEILKKPKIKKALDRVRADRGLKATVKTSENVPDWNPNAD